MAEGEHPRLGFSTAGILIFLAVTHALNLRPRRILAAAKLADSRARYFHQPAVDFELAAGGCFTPFHHIVPSSTDDHEFQGKQLSFGCRKNALRLPTANVEPLRTTTAAFSVLLLYVHAFSLAGKRETSSLLPSAYTERTFYFNGRTSLLSQGFHNPLRGLFAKFTGYELFLKTMKNTAAG